LLPFVTVSFQWYELPGTGREAGPAT
jgi:hypothetical protein